MTNKNNMHSKIIFDILWLDGLKFWRQKICAYDTLRDFGAICQLRLPNFADWLSATSIDSSRRQIGANIFAKSLKRAFRYSLKALAIHYILHSITYYQWTPIFEIRFHSMHIIRNAFPNIAVITSHSRRASGYRRHCYAFVLDSSLGEWETLVESLFTCVIRKL